MMSWPPCWPWPRSRHEQSTQEDTSKAIASVPGLIDTSPADSRKCFASIDAARTRAVAAVNTTLIELYWSIGEFISRKIAMKAGVKEWSSSWPRPSAIAPGMRGYSARTSGG